VTHRVNAGTVTNVARGWLEHEIRSLPQVLACSIEEDDIVVLVQPSADPLVVENAVHGVLRRAGVDRQVRVFGGARPAFVEPVKIRSPRSVLVSSIGGAVVLAAGVWVAGATTGLRSPPRAKAPLAAVLAPPVERQLVTVPFTFTKPVLRPPVVVPPVVVPQPGPGTAKPPAHSGGHKPPPVHVPGPVPTPTIPTPIPTPPVPTPPVPTPHPKPPHGKESCEDEGDRSREHRAKTESADRDDDERAEARHRDNDDDESCERPDHRHHMARGEEADRDGGHHDTASEALLVPLLAPLRRSPWRIR
jgi:hypothetical protein